MPLFFLRRPPAQRTPEHSNIKSFCNAPRLDLDAPLSRGHNGAAARGRSSCKSRHASWSSRRSTVCARVACICFFVFPSGINARRITGSCDITSPYAPKASIARRDFSYWRFVFRAPFAWMAEPEPVSATLRETLAFMLGRREVSFGLRVSRPSLFDKNLSCGVNPTGVLRPALREDTGSGAVCPPHAQW